MYLPITGTLSTVATMVLFSVLPMGFNAIAMARILFGSCLLGGMSQMVFAHERMIYVSMLWAKLEKNSSYVSFQMMTL